MSGAWPTFSSSPFAVLTSSLLAQLGSFQLKWDASQLQTMTATRPSRSSTPTSHPLIQPHTDPPPTASSSSLLVSPTVSRPPSPLLVSRASTPNGAGPSGGGGGIRSRRSPLPHPTTLAEVESAAATSSVTAQSSVSGMVEPDVTRPSLRRATNDALGVLDGVRAASDDGRGEGYDLKTDKKGKGKAREYVRTNGAGGSKEREVIVHKVRSAELPCGAERLPSRLRY